MNPKEIILERFRSKGSKPEDAKTLAGLLRINERELYSTSDRYLFELIQNADDKPGPGGAVSIRIELTDNYLVILHNGMPFSEGDVRAICDAAQSNKAKDATKTGYKGIGFKSVFTDARTVYIRSGDYCFKFDSLDPVYQTLESLYKYELDGMLPERRAKELKDWTAKPEYLDLENIPWQIKPIWVEYEAVPGELTATSFRGDATVAFALYVTAQTLREKDYEGTIQGVMADHRLLLFLRHVEEIHFENRFTLRIQRDPETKIRTILSTDDDQHYISGTFGISISDENFKAAGVDIRRVEGSNGQRVFQTGSGARIKEIPEKLAHLDESSLTFCALLVDGKLKVDNESILFNYLPTEDERFKFPFLVNGDFITTSNRERIQHENVWNIYLFHRIGYLAVQWLHELMDRFRDSYLNMLRYPSNPGQEREDLREILEAYKKGFESALGDIRFLWDSEGHRRLISEVTLDNWGVHEVIPKSLLISAGFPGPYIASDLAQTRRADLSNLIDKYGKELDIDAYKAILSADRVMLWMGQDVGNSKTVLTWLIGPKRLSKLDGVFLYPGTKGGLYAAGQIYASLDEGLWGWLHVPVLHPEVRDLLKDQEVGLLEYNVHDFVLHEVIGKKSRVLEFISNVENSILYYRALGAVQGFLSDSVHFIPQGLKSFPIALEGGSFHEWRSGQVFAYDEAVAGLVDKRALPVSQVPMIHRQYQDGASEGAEGQRTLWKKLGALEFGNNEWSLMAMIGSVEQLTYHFSSLELDARLSASRMYWHFLNERFLVHLSNADLTKVKHLLKQLPVLVGPGLDVLPLGEAYLADEFTREGFVREMIQFVPEIESQLISSGYLSDTSHKERDEWRKVFTSCGIKTNLDDYLPSILNSIPTSDLSDSTGLLRFLYKNRSRFDLKSVDSQGLRLLTLSGERMPVTKVHVLSYDQRAHAPEVLPCIDIPTLLDNSLLFDQTPEPIEFYVKLGCSVIDSKDKFLSKKMEALNDRMSEGFGKEESIGLVRCLTEFAGLDELLDKYRRVLSNLPLMADGSEEVPVFRPANDLYLDATYVDSNRNREILSGLGLVGEFVSRQYLDSCPGPGLSRLFKGICRREVFDVVLRDRVYRSEIPPDYLEYIDSLNAGLRSNAQFYPGQHFIENYCELNVFRQLGDPAVLRIFWAKVTENEFIRNHVFRRHKYNYYYSPPQRSENIDSPVVFALKRLACIPCKDGSWARPGDCYVSEYARYFPDNCVSSLEVLDEKVNEVRIADILGVRSELGLADLLGLVKLHANYKKLFSLGVWGRIKELLKEKSKLKVAETSALEDFIATGILPDQFGEFHPVGELYCVQDVSILGVGHSKYILHSHLQDISGYFRLVSIDDRFEFFPEGERRDDAFVRHLKDRLPLIAGVCDPDGWQELCSRWDRSVNQYSFFTVSSMYHRCMEPNIEGSQLSLYVKDASCYYKGSWSGQKAADLVHWLYEDLFSVGKVTGLNGSVEFSLFQDLLLDDRRDILNYIRNKGLHLPEELAVLKPQEGEGTPGYFPAGNEGGGTSRGPASGGYKGPAFGEGVSTGPSRPSGSTEGNNWGPEDRDLLKELLKGRHLSSDQMKDINLLALVKAIRYFKTLPNVDTVRADDSFEDTYSTYYLKDVVIDGMSTNIMCRSAHGGSLYVSNDMLRYLRRPNYLLFVSTGSSDNAFVIFKTVEELHEQAGKDYFFKVHPVDRERVSERLLDPEDEIYDQPSWIIPVRGSNTNLGLLDRNSNTGPGGTEDMVTGDGDHY